MAFTYLRMLQVLHGISLSESWMEVASSRPARSGAVIGPARAAPGRLQLSR